MSQRLKLAGAILLAVVATFLLTAHFVGKNTLNSLKVGFVEMSTFNQISQVENYDRLEGLLMKGCTREALELIRLQRSSNLSVIKDSFTWGESVKATVKSRNPDIYERSVRASSPQSFTVPSC